MKRIYVGNLAAGTTERELRMLFDRYGHVEKAGIVCKRETGEQLGFGFVIMRNDVHGAKAIRSLDGCNLKGQRIHVLEAIPPLKSEDAMERPVSPLARLRTI